MRTEKIMVVDDEPRICDMLQQALSQQGYGVTAYSDSQAALECIRKGASFDMVLTDVRMPRVDGLTLLREVRSRCAETKVILITGFASSQIAAQAIEGGAYTYLYKPFSISQVLSTVREALDGVSESGSPFELIGESVPMQRVYKLIRKVAASESNVLILGESGTGKELTARTIHHLSARRERPFIPVNCGAIPGGLVESELFGHERGAFTGAVARKLGKVELAEGGTLFLDEIGDLAVEAHAKLLRLL